MSTTIGIGVPVPRLLPVTGTFALPFAAYLSVLAVRVSLARVQEDKYIGDKASSGPDPDDLQIAVRSHANYTENVPFALLVASIAELNGANRKILTYALGALFVLRVAHVELGLRAKNALGQGRAIGHFATQGIVTGLAGYSAYLVKAWWGF